MYSNIVVGTDGSATAKQALGHAVDLAVNGGTVHIVSAYRSSGAASRSVPRPSTGTSIRIAKIDTILDSAAAVARSKGSRSRPAVERDPGDAIVAIAGEVGADAVVVGNKGMRGAKRFLLGSVPNKVAHNAPCTVVIVKTT